MLSAPSFFEIKSMVGFVPLEAPRRYESVYKKYLHVNQNINKFLKILHYVKRMICNEKKLRVWNHLSLTLSKSSSNLSKTLLFLSFRTTQKITKENETHMFLPSINALSSPNLFPHRNQPSPNWSLITHKPRSTIYTQTSTKGEYDYRTPPLFYIRNIYSPIFSPTSLACQ